MTTKAPRRLFDRERVDLLLDELSSAYAERDALREEVARRDDVAVSCGGCRGLGAHSPRCHTQPGALWRRLSDAAESLGDSIGSNDPDAANTAYGLASRLRDRWQEAVNTPEPPGLVLSRTTPTHESETLQ